MQEMQGAIGVEWLGPKGRLAYHFDQLKPKEVLVDGIKLTSK